MEVENNVQIRKFTWKIENFSSIKDKKLYSEIFYVGGYPWKLLMFPKGNGVDHISIYLTVADSATLPDGWSRYAKFKLALLNQIDPQISTTGGVTQHEFKAAEDDWGFTSFLPLSKLHDPTSGCLVNDSCLLEAYISTDRTIDLKSHKLIVEVGPGKVKGMEANYAPAVLSSPGQDKTKSTIQNLPTSRSSFLSDTIEAEVPKTEDMDTFFTSLEYELGSSNIVSSQEEAKEALAKIEGALNMTLTNFHDLGKSYPLKKAFKTLYSFDCSSTITDEQKTELLAMEESLKELPDRAAKAVQDRKLLSEKESVKLTVTRNLERSLVKFKEAKTEEEKVEQKIAALYKQVDEEQKNKENILTEMKEIFRISKELKMELEAIEKELPEYEAKAKVAEEEQKTVEAKWVRMKDLISSIKEKI